MFLDHLRVFPKRRHNKCVLDSCQLTIWHIVQVNRLLRNYRLIKWLGYRWTSWTSESSEGRAGSSKIREPIKIAVWKSPCSVRAVRRHVQLLTSLPLRARTWFLSPPPHVLFPVSPILKPALQTVLFCFKRLFGDPQARFGCDATWL